MTVTPNRWLARQLRPAGQETGLSSRHVSCQAPHRAPSQQALLSPPPGPSPPLAWGPATALWACPSPAPSPLPSAHTATAVPPSCKLPHQPRDRASAWGLKGPGFDSHRGHTPGQRRQARTLQSAADAPRLSPTPGACFQSLPPPQPASHLPPGWEEERRERPSLGGGRGGKPGTGSPGQEPSRRGSVALSWAAGGVEGALMEAGRGFLLHQRAPCSVL